MLVLASNLTYKDLDNFLKNKHRKKKFRLPNSHPSAGRRCDKTQKTKIYEISSKTIEIDAAFILTEMNNELNINFLKNSTLGGARGEMVIIVGNEHGDSSSNPGRE